MKILGKLVTTMAVLGGILIGGAVVLPSLTKNRSSEIAMAIDNVNPLVTTETVYTATSVQPVREFTGGAGEKEYEYRLVTYNAKGQARTVTFDAQWRLKRGKYLAIRTKGQNVESWQAVAREHVPSGVRQNILMA
ncbi:YxeA family protein [Levilactobacillus zymae]|uniref:YxeA family protein n=1 Tax=Levilactobacillus zymae TaxID=267363 RepID=UPI0028BA3780|nr:YxeA family protein [Levilactobacillus zymae]MDT6980530.1 YxeA family protein [Levilactobacillus zymae]